MKRIEYLGRESCNHNFCYPGTKFAVAAKKKARMWAILRDGFVRRSFALFLRDTKNKHGPTV